MQRVVSFSVPPTETNHLRNVKILKKFCSDTGSNFSHQVLLAISKHVKEMGLTDDNSRS
jgi:hypothetical protein